MKLLSTALPILSAWDPRANGSGSVDPLGALRAYTSIANALLPGVTTITTRARYLSWVCAGLRLLDETAHAPHGGRAGRLRRLRLLPWERILALAVGFHADGEELANDDDAWRQLRGVRRVRNAVRSGVRSPDFFMLKGQAGIGGIGTYWVALVSGGLVEDEPATLTRRGEAVADCFLSRPGTPDRTRLRRLLGGERLAFQRETLAQWGTAASLDSSRALKTERDLLADALLEPAEHRCVAHTFPARGATSTKASFKKMAAALRRQSGPLPSRLADVMDAAQAFEALHGALLGSFDRIRTVRADGRPFPLTAAVKAVAEGEAQDVGALAANLRERITPELPQAVTRTLLAFLIAVEPIHRQKSRSAQVEALIRHHQRVQEGKVDATRQPKAPWIERRGNKVVVAPRYALEEAPERDDGQFTHTYRVEQLDGMLSEIGWSQTNG